MTLWVLTRMPIAIPMTRLETNARLRSSLRSLAHALATASAPCVASSRPTVSAHMVKAPASVE